MLAQQSLRPEVSQNRSVLTRPEIQPRPKIQCVYKLLSSSARRNSDLPCEAMPRGVTWRRARPRSPTRTSGRQAWRRPPTGWTFTRAPPRCLPRRNDVGFPELGSCVRAGWRRTLATTMRNAASRKRQTTLQQPTLREQIPQRQVLHRLSLRWPVPRQPIRPRVLWWRNQIPVVWCSLVSPTWREPVAWDLSSAASTVEQMSRA